MPPPAPYGGANILSQVVTHDPLCRKCYALGVFEEGGPSLSELVKQALSSTERGYDLLAEKFDHTPFRTPDPVLRTTSAVLAKGPPVVEAIDLCCGTGAAMHWLRPIVQKRYVGVDFSDGMLDVARKRLADAPGNAAIELIRDNIFWLALEPTFDLVTTFGSLGHIPRGSESRFCQAVARLLKPGGRFATVTTFAPKPSSGVYWFSHAFNAAMHVRNAVWSPQFIMYYLTFLLPQARTELEKAGLQAEVLAPFEAPYDSLRLLVATKRG